MWARSSTKATAWGLPMFTLRAFQLRPSRLTVTPSSGRSARPMETVMAPSLAMCTFFTPPRVATARSPCSTSPARWRYPAKTRTPLPHISAIEPSALR